MVWKAVRLPVAVGLVIVVAAVALGIASSRYDRGALDPKGVDPGGSRALAVLLADRGVAVHRVTGATAALAGAGPSSTIFLPFPDREPLPRLARLKTRPAKVGLVLVAPSAAALQQVTDEASLTGVQAVRRRDPGCAYPVATTAGDADLGGGRYRLRSSAGESCYGDSLLTAAGSSGQPVVIAGAPDPFTNDRLAQRGNAALALGLLGGTDELWWVLPDPAAGASGPHRSLLSVLPDPVTPVLWELALATLLLALWRGRRLGPVVTEALPVVVRAAESVEGRARLYRRARARDRAAEALRAGALAKLLPYLGLAAGTAAPAAVVAAVAAHSGRPPDEGAALLYGPGPADDAALVGLAAALDQLVASTLDPGAHRP